MTKQNNIFLIGPTGAGKTTVGKLLAEKLNLKFYDADAEIEKHVGMSITEIFAVEKEMGFRKYEEAILAMLTAMSGIVLATGAGAILSARNRTLLLERGKVIYLQVSLAKQYERIKHCTNRPLLQLINPDSVLAKMRQERELLYQSIANITFCTDDVDAEEIAEKIIFDIKGYNP